jgi:hypothetical protein
MDFICKARELVEALGVPIVLDSEVIGQADAALSAHKLDYLDGVH